MRNPGADKVSKRGAVTNRSELSRIAEEQEMRSSLARFQKRKQKVDRHH